MTTSTETLERALIGDVESLGDRLGDDRLLRDLYAAIAGHALHHRDGRGRLAVSWGRAEEIINGARALEQLPPLEGLTQSGHEGGVTDRARKTLEQLGWELRERRPFDHDNAHVDRPEQPPPGDHQPPEWERTAHAEADQELRRRREGG